MKKQLIKHLSVFLFLLIILSISVFADNKITIFEGGHHKVSFRFYSSVLTGIGARTSNFGNTISSLIDDPALASVNPAGLAFIERSIPIDVEKVSLQNLRKAVERLEFDDVPVIFTSKGISAKDLIEVLKDLGINKIEIPVNTKKLTLDYAPSFSLNIGDYYWKLDDIINTQIDDGIEEMKSEDLQPTYPEVNILGEQIGGLNGFAASFLHTKFGSLGIAFHKPLILDLGIIGNGISVTVSDTSTNNEGNLETTMVPLGIDFFSNSKLDFNQVDIGYGKKLHPDFSLGLGISCLNSIINADFTANIGGIISQIGENNTISEAFDDPNDEYRNTLNDTITIDFHENLIGAKLSCSYRPNDWLYLDAVYSLPRKAHLDGSLRIVQHTLGALNLSYDEEAGEELFDIEMLKPAQIAYTNRTIYESSTLEFSYPGNFGICASATKGNWKYILSYEKPLGELSFDYECDVYEDGMEKIEGEFVNYADTTHKSYTIGLKMKHNIKFAVGYGRLALSGRIILADQILEGFKDDNDESVEPKKNILLGSLALGCGFKLTRNIAIDFNLLALPSPILRTTLAYEF